MKKLRLLGVKTVAAAKAGNRLVLLVKHRRSPYPNDLRHTPCSNRMGANLQSEVFERQIFAMRMTREEFRPLSYRSQVAQPKFFDRHEHCI